MNPYLTSAIIGGTVMFALQFVGLGFSDDMEAEATTPPAISVAHR